MISLIENIIGAILVLYLIVVLVLFFRLPQDDSRDWHGAEY